MTMMLEAPGIPAVEIFRPTIFLDLDDVLTVSREFSSYQVMATFKSGDIDGWPELWDGLIFAEARDNLAALHGEFWPQYVVSSSWSNYLTREQMQDVFRRTGLGFVADNLHTQWTTPKSNEWTRLDEIEYWIEDFTQPGSAILVLDDHLSGSALHESLLDRHGQVVLCDPGVGLVAHKLAEAQIRLRAQEAPCSKY